MHSALHPWLYTGNLKSLESLTQLTSVNFRSCPKIEGNINRSHESTQNNGLGHYESLMPQSNIITTASRPSTCISFDHTSGVIPPLIFVLLLEGNAINLQQCGEFTMPSSEMMAQAPPDVIKRFESVKEVKLSGMKNLGGAWVEAHTHHAVYCSPVVARRYWNLVFAV